jgi:hypothetical protein
MRGDNKFLVRMAVLLMSAALVATSCQFEVITPEPAMDIVLKSSHGRYVTAMGQENDWVLKQELAWSECALLTQESLPNGRVALKTCHGLYVTAPESGGPRWDWMLRQEPKLGECGQFDVYDLGSDRVAYRTCAEAFLTAGDGNWPAGLEWAIIGETQELQAWEEFTWVREYPAAPSVIADFEDCAAVTNLGEPAGVAFDPGSGDQIELSLVQEAGHGCVARLAYDMIGWSGFWLGLGDADLGLYNQIAFDIKADSQQDCPQQTRVELKRADLHEIASEETPGVTTQWQTVAVNLADLGDSLSSLADMEELILVFDAGGTQKAGVILLDNITLRREGDDP